LPYLELPPLVVLVGACLLVALIFAWEATAGQFLTLLVNLMERVSFFGVNLLQPIIDGIEWLNATVHNAYVESLEAVEWSWHTFMLVNATAWQDVSGALADGFEATERAFVTVRRVIVPAALAVALGPVWAAIQTVQTLLKEHHVSIGRVAARVEELPGQIADQAVAASVAAVKALVHAEAILPPLSFPNPWDAIRDLLDEAGKLRAQLGKYAKILTPAGIVGLVGAAVFSEFGLGSLRCSNNKKLLKGTCGLVPKVLEDLLAGLVAVVGTISIIELAEVYQGLFIDVSGEVLHFWRADLGHTPGNPALGDTGFSGSYGVPAGGGARNPALGVSGV
jgi:hypothetical protein